MKRVIEVITFAALLAALPCRGAESVAGPRCDFDSAQWLRQKTLVRGLPLIPRTLFYIADDPAATDGRVLVVEADRASGVLIFRIAGLDLKKHPVMRWRWRIIRRVGEPPAGELPDDQACVLYISDGTPLKQKCVAYRWEHRIPLGFRRMVQYGGAQVDALCIRNVETPVGEWVVDERNVLEDFKAAFGEAPSSAFAIAIGANSQHSNSYTRVEIDYIEFRSASRPPAR